MIITKAYKIRLYPTKCQRVFFNKTMGACRVIYNEMLYKMLFDYNKSKKKYNYYEKYNLFTMLKNKYIWMKEVDSQALAQVYRDLENAYKNYFSHIAKLPKLKKKKEKNTYRNCRLYNNINVLFATNSYIKIPKVGLVKYRQDYDFSKLNIQKVYNITVERSKTNKYYCSICVDVEIPEYEHTGEVIGVDLGIKDLVIDSNENKYSNPKYQIKAEKKIKHLQRLYSKKTKGSKNQEKARLKLATAHEKLSNKRKDNLHKITTKLIKENDVICIENLSVKNMTKNHKLAKAIQDASFGTLISMLKYKAAWHNRKIIEIGRFYPSSKLCHCCGHRMSYMGLEIREWTCPRCKAVHDRDINAAINIKNEGLRILDKSTGEVPETYMPVENPTMDDKLAITLKSSGSMKQENI
ncbi:MAG: transposase [Methanobrevibacter sp.]|nr:transposase [Methanobrevibacter sp.]